MSLPRSYLYIGGPHTQNLTNLGNSVTTTTKKKSELLFKLLGHTVEALSYTNIFFITAFTFSHLTKKKLELPLLFTQCFTSAAKTKLAVEMQNALTSHDSCGPQEFDAC